MTTVRIDNSINADIDAIVTWQYDNSAKICQLMDQFKSWFNDSCGEIWGNIAAWIGIGDPEKANDFILAVLGRIIGAPRLDVVVGNETRTMSTELYRRIVVARYRILASTSKDSDGNDIPWHRDATIDRAREFLNLVFDGHVSITDNHDMSVSFSWDESEPETNLEIEQKYIFDHAMDDIFIFPAGVHDNDGSDSRMFWLAGDTAAEAKPTDFVHFGGLDNSSFAWKKSKFLE